MSNTARELREWYQNNFTKLTPSKNSLAMTEELWDQWESQGISRPDIHAVTSSVAEREHRFFQEVVHHCGLYAQKPIGSIEHCPIELYDYNFRKATASDGCLILTDEAFERLLFVLSMGITLLVRCELPDVERGRLSQWLRRVTEKWYLGLETMPIPPGGMERAFVESYESAEMGAFLYNGMYAFSLAHEIGHHALGHDLNPTKFMISAKHRETIIPVDRQSHEDELAADRYALRVFLRLNEIKDGLNPLCFVWWFKFAPLFLFDIFEALDHLKGVAGDSDSHPSPATRRSNLLLVDSLQSEDALYQDMRSELFRILTKD